MEDVFVIYGFLSLDSKQNRMREIAFSNISSFCSIVTFVLQNLILKIARKKNFLSNDFLAPWLDWTGWWD